MYVAKHKPNQLTIGTGKISVVTGWTPKDIVAKKLDSSLFAAVGQLYSPTRGISFLIRNLLLNPHVRFLVVLNGTEYDKNSGACQCLLDFFRIGFIAGSTDTGKSAWRINSSATGFVDWEIPEFVLEDLRRNLTVYEVSSVSEAVNAVEDLSCLEAEPWGEPLEFPFDEALPTVLPGSRYGHRVEGKTVAETWVKILQRIRTTGTIRPTGYDGYWQELIDLMAIVTDEPDEFYFPDPNYLPVDRDFLREYIPQILSDTPSGVKYTYGQRLRSWFGADQIEQVVRKLVSEIDAASAVMSLWDVADHEKGGSPCLNHIWLRVVEGELSLTATFRSNDMFGAWPANAMGLRALQKHIRDRIAEESEYDLRMGPLITISESSHIYDDSWSDVDGLIRKYYGQSCPGCYDDVGNFLIEIEGDEIAIAQTTPSGEIVARYRGRQPLKLVREICFACPGIRPDHSAYLGIELQKAFNCLKMRVDYVQDR